MDKAILKKGWVLGILLVLLNLVFGFIIWVASEVINTNLNNVYFVGGLISAYALGVYYIQYFKNPMEKKTRINATITYYILIIILGNWYFWAIDAQPFILFLIILIILSAVYCVGVYFLIKSGEKRGFKFQTHNHHIKN